MIKLVIEGIGRFSENCYLTGWPIVAAACNTVVVAMSFRVARLAVVDNNRSAQLAICLAVFVTTCVGGSFLPRLVN